MARVPAGEYQAPGSRMTHEDAIEEGIEAAAKAVSNLPMGERRWDKKEYMIAQTAARAAVAELVEPALCPVCELPLARTARERLCSRDEGCPLMDPPIFVTYDDAANGISDVQGNITDLEAFCRAIEQGRIKNVRVAPELTPPNKAEPPAHS